MAEDEQLRIIENLAEIPSFADEAADAAFWSDHRLSDALLEEMRPLGADEAPAARSSTSITLRIDGTLLARLQALAARRKMPYQRLLKQFLAERLLEEEARQESSTGVEPDTASHPARLDSTRVIETARSITRLALDLETAVASLAPGGERMPDGPPR